MRHQDLIVYLLTRKVDVTTENQYSSTCLKCFKVLSNQNNKRGGRKKTKCNQMAKEISMSLITDTLLPM